MTSDRDSTRSVRSWLDDGSTAIPDRVLDAVLAELSATPQRRPWWPLRRYDMTKPFLTIAGAAVAVVLAVVVGSALLPRISGVGSSAGEQPITGEVKFMLAGGEVTLVVDAVASGSSLRGTANAVSGASILAYQFQCLAERDDGTWLLGGDLEQSTVGDGPVGSRGAVIVRDGTPQAFNLVLEGDDAPAVDCPAFLAAVPNETMQPAIEGELTLPD
jgi:hypothetical protein